MNNPTTPIREFSDKDDVESDVHFLAYEANWHKKIAKDGSIGNSLQNWPPSQNSRIVLVSCDRAAFPKVSEKQVQTLANQTLGDIGKQRHILRVYTIDSLRTQVENLILQTMIEHGMALPSEQKQVFEKSLYEEAGGWNARDI
ncbi:hypothetical protein [Arthrobacter sp. CJ23]|uniref:hypothetical protein n=1 Tax=Arthrobacter sp. CJ23 TaxID=2972479 RepID=UPI00215C539E|nr:hypothetical protein [Arthrobacter sp. CJ23]UVJ39051.1 hypothetical protein NVV90_17850 [Arthrobacter sp. CJ23]